MANKQSYVVEFLGLEVSEAVKGKLVNAEEKLANAVLANTKLRNHVSKIHKILKDNGVEYSADDLNKCIDLFKEAVKETKEGEFSPTKKEVISLDINPDLFSECGLDINIDIDDQIHDNSLESVSDASDNIRVFVSENIDETVQNIIKETITGMSSSVQGIDNIIYWTLKGNVSLVKLLDNIVTILKSVKGFNENRMIKRFIRPITDMVKVIDDSIIKLSSMSNDSTLDEIEITFNECMEKIMGCLWFLTFLPDYNGIETLIRTLLLCCLDSEVCAKTVGIVDEPDIDSTVIDKLFDVFEKNSVLLDLSNINTLDDLLNISLTIDIEDNNDNGETNVFTVEELANEFEDIEYTKNTDKKSDENKLITINHNKKNKLGFPSVVQFNPVKLRTSIFG